ncbi:glucose-1-phosphate cytidylyltransferase [Lentzea atacamensis]|uniref:Glucose-1-phosphate cytidylyltransferase n=1 Tax=Lentzea atacamensis TaxID=531938 RepID=A0ABX9EEX8_9PSEU|nr:glucose-1-phosphate cytidylyltransferase [Lentzea atacamensis]RAS69741.1 glucose-1-phosphate cytidylyltransferase [Lentzea atacamensis]
MKVVLFCGGYGMRMRSSAHDDVPKPMQLVGPRPLLWHIMRYYAHFGHTDFILCLGYGAQHVKDYFLHYRETSSNDFVLQDGEVELFSTDISDWRITFADTGVETPIGERLRRVRHHLGDDEVFLANYSDVLSDAPLDIMIDRLVASDNAASMLVVPPQSSFHCVQLDEASTVTSLALVSELPVWENGGFFVLRQEIFDKLPVGGDLVDDVCGALVREGRLLAHRHRGFWQSADTVKERIRLEASYASGERPWMMWEHEPSPAPVPLLEEAWSS